MRYPASEKAEIIDLVEHSHLSDTQALRAKINLPESDLSSPLISVTDAGRITSSFMRSSNVVPPAMYWLGACTDGAQFDGRTWLTMAARTSAARE